MFAVFAALLVQRSRGEELILDTTSAVHVLDDALGVFRDRWPRAHFFELVLLLSLLRFLDFQSFAGFPLPEVTHVSLHVLSAFGDGRTRLDPHHCLLVVELCTLRLLLLLQLAVLI